jgi:hypothetical protein
MFADELRLAVESAARVELPAVSVQLWKAFGAGQVTEAEAEGLANLIEAKALQTVARPPSRKPLGARPRTDASLERRRRWAASGRLPPKLASHFTTAEVAVLAVVAVEIAKGADCTLAISHIADLAGVGETSVRRALRAAQALGLITVEERRVSAFRNLTNVIRIVSLEWQAWIRLPRSGGGCQGKQGSNTKDSRSPKKRSQTPLKGAAERQTYLYLQIPKGLSTKRRSGSRRVVSQAVV